jgi:hypothetical protein
LDLDTGRDVLAQEMMASVTGLRDPAYRWAAANARGPPLLEMLSIGWMSGASRGEEPGGRGHVVGERFDRETASQMANPAGTDGQRQHADAVSNAGGLGGLGMWGRSADQALKLNRSAGTSGVSPLSGASDNVTSARACRHSWQEPRVGASLLNLSDLAHQFVDAGVRQRIASVRRERRSGNVPREAVIRARQAM